MEKHMLKTTTKEKKAAAFCTSVYTIYRKLVIAPTSEKECGHLLEE